ncbi:helix-turn-helix domain-containing protein [Pseudomonas nitroreducens]|uniref:helix-turn-helix domain-containing protein n=1 Tax=Pseudomonas nitroreducens TaxID=46680 RepID=UPI0020A0E120|nr:AraC family transcriptional regulator [Pseudomonas nitroreducens]MCP1625896.1 AraC-like DNA-binding protein [Pseudomonas nitroreducens]
MSVREQAWQGELWLGADFCLVAGTTGHARPHAHYAHQLLLACAGEVTALIDEQKQQGSLLVIASNQRHAILPGEQRVITLFAEPLAFELADLERLCRQIGPDLQRLATGLRELPRRQLDPRLEKALQRIRALDDGALPAQSLAEAASLSLSQLERLFSGTLGLSVRRLVLWQRLRQALRLAMAGDSLTNAAIATGFADSAHFSRSVRSQFGIRADLTLRQLKLRLLS